MNFEFSNYHQWLRILETNQVETDSDGSDALHSKVRLVLFQSLVNKCSRGGTDEIKHEYAYIHLRSNTHTRMHFFEHGRICLGVYTCGYLSSTK